MPEAKLLEHEIKLTMSCILFGQFLSQKLIFKKFGLNITQTNNNHAQNIIHVQKQ